MEYRNTRTRKDIVYKGVKSIQRASKSLLNCIQLFKVYIKPGSLLAFKKEISLEYSQPISPLARYFAFSSEEFAIGHC